MVEDQSYDRISRSMHWGMAFVILLMLSLSWWMGLIPKPLRFMVYNVHKLIGLSLLVLCFYRLMYRGIQGFVRHAHLPAIHRMLAAIVHGLLYLCMLLMPLSGWWMSTASNHIPHLGHLPIPMPWVKPSKALAAFASDAHQILAWAWIALLVLHIGAALYHRCQAHDGVWQGMAWRKKIV